MSDEFTSGRGRAAFCVAARLIRYAARSAPPQLAERLEEEWLADLGAQPSSFTGLSFALGCCWATCVIAREHRAASAALSSSGRKALTFGEFRSRSMTRLKWLWVAAAALAVTAVVIFAAVQFAERVLPFVARHSGYFAGADGRLGLWLSLAMGGGSIFGMIAMCWHQMRARLSRPDGPRHHGLNRWTDSPLPSLPAHPLRGSYWFGALVIGATSGLLFAGSARFGFAAMSAAGTELRMIASGMAVFFAAAGAGLLVVLACYCCIHRHLDGGSDASSG